RDRPGLAEPAEVVVRDEAARARAELLDLREQLRPALLGHVEAQLLAFEPDRVEAGLLAQHDPALGADERGRERLDRLRDVELAGDGAALTHEQILADDRLPRLERRPGRLANERRDGAQPVEPELRLDA